MDSGDAVDVKIDEMTAAMGMGVELMMAGMHEAKNRLGNLRAAVQLEMLHSRESIGDPGDDHLEAAMREIDLLEDLLRRVTHVPVPRRKWAAITSVSLDALIRNTLTRLACRADLKGVTLTSVSRGRIRMREDELELLQRIVFALADNAVTFAPAKTGNVTVIAEVTDGSKLMVEVRDDGPGVLVSPVGKIFLPSFTTRRAGTGMGLYLAKSLAERQLGGRIIYRKNEEGGASFIVSIPVDGS